MFTILSEIPQDSEFGFELIEAKVVENNTSIHLGRGK